MPLIYFVGLSRVRDLVEEVNLLVILFDSSLLAAWLLSIFGRSDGSIGGFIYLGNRRNLFNMMFIKVK